MTTLQLKTFVLKRSRHCAMTAKLSVLSKDYSFHRLTLYSLPPASWSTIRGWGRLSVQGADKRVKCSVSHGLRAAVSCVETAHPSSLNVSIMWFSCKLGPLIWGIGACTLRAQWISTSAVRRLRSLTVESAGVRLSILTFFWIIEQPREIRMSDLGLQPGEVWKQAGRLPAEGRRGSSENTSSCLFLLPVLPSLHMCHLFCIRSLVSWNLNLNSNFFENLNPA
jgi:hypothetical protein